MTRPATKDETTFDEARKVVAQPLEIAPPVVEPVGLGYVARFAQMGVTMRLRRVRESGGELSGELTVEMNPNYEGGPAEHLAQARFNLSSLHARGSWAKDLNERRAAKWRDALEQFCLGVLRLHRSRLKFTVVGKKPRRQSPPRALGPLFPLKQPSVVFAPGGSGKTTLAALVGVQIETGAEVFPGWAVHESVPVLVLDWETTEDDWNDLVASVASGARIEPPDIGYVRVRGSLSDHLEEIAEYVTENAIGFVIVDSVEAACGGREGENWNDRANRLFDAVDLLGVTVLLIDHVSSDDLDGTRTVSKSYGGVFKLNRARQVLELRREKEPANGVAELILREVKVNATAQLPVRGLRCHYEDQGIRLEWAEVEAAELVRKLSQPQQVLRLLRSGGRTGEAIDEAIGFPNPKHRNAVLSRMAKAGQVTRLEDGRWGLAQ